MEQQRPHQHRPTFRNRDRNLSSRIAFSETVARCEPTELMGAGYYTEGAVSLVAVIKVDTHGQHIPKD